jgi:hypothetical protein
MQIRQCEISGSHGDAAEDSILLACCAASTGQYLTDASKDRSASEASITINQSTRRNMQEDSNFQIRYPF